MFGPALRCRAGLLFFHGDSNGSTRDSADEAAVFSPGGQCPNLETRLVSSAMLGSKPARCLLPFEAPFKT
jgi:hypothetical protein